MRVLLFTMLWASFASAEPRNVVVVFNEPAARAAETAEVRWHRGDRLIAKKNLKRAVFDDLLKRNTSIFGALSARGESKFCVASLEVSVMRAGKQESRKVCVDQLSDADSEALGAWMSDVRGWLAIPLGV